jgi:hypothetical protein
MIAATRNPSFGRASSRLLAVLLAALLPALSCESEGGESTGGETHFLASCEPSSSVCGAELLCLCGVCTHPCDQADACGALPGATCRASGLDECAEAHCDVECLDDTDCAVVSASHRCENGLCRAEAPGAGEGGAGGQGGAEALCASGEVEGNEVAVLGDSFFATTRQIVANLTDFARAAGVLQPDETYRDYSNLTGNALALGGNGIASQYSAAVSDGAVELVLMNGGGADALTAPCETAEECPALPAAASALRELFGTMESGGVRAIVYAFYPDPVDASVRSRIDVLRPLIAAECEMSPVPCHWLDLRENFAGNYDEYVLPDGLNPTDAGSLATAEVIWQTLGPCVAEP